MSGTGRTLAAVLLATLPPLSSAQPLEPPSPEAARQRDTQPVRLKFPQPAYPESLRRADVEGDVLAWLYIDQDGRVKAISIRTSPHSLFSQATIAALSQWEFRPPTKDGKPTPFIGEFLINFRLSD